jgi:hypothetical protein
VDRARCFRLEDWIGEDNPVLVIDVFVEELDLAGLGFVKGTTIRILDQLFDHLVGAGE